MKINVKVKPSSGEHEIKIREGVYLVKLKSRAEDNKANMELLKLLQKHFKKDVRIVSGKTSKNKIVEVLN
jgi:uncharacterized protein (TIGR00251 family)